MSRRCKAQPLSLATFVHFCKHLDVMFKSEKRSLTIYGLVIALVLLFANPLIK